MAVMRNSIIFGGVDSADFGIYIGGEGTFNAPKRDVEMISIPGRNGAFALDKGRFENIEVTYSAFNFEPDMDTFSAQLEAFRNAICSQKGYQRLTDTFHPDEYRMAAYIDGLEIKPVNFNTASTFDIVFDCKPQRFLTSGEEPITIGEWRETETASGSIATFDAEDTDAVKSLTCDIEPTQDLHGYDKPWSGGAGKNKMPQPTISLGGTNPRTATVYFDTPLPIGTYICSWQVSGTYTGTAQDAGIGAYASDNSSSGGVNKTSGALVTTKDSARLYFYMPQTNYGNGETLIYSNFQIEQGTTATTYEPYSNICPISGHDEVNVSVCGVNLLDAPRLFDDGDYYSTNADGSITVNYSDVRSWSDAPQMLLKAGTYTMSRSNTSGIVQMRDVIGEAWVAYMGDGVATSTFTLTKPTYIAIRLCASASSYPLTVNAQLELGTTATDYEPYNGTTYNVSFGTAGTVYGGTLDVVSGVLMVTDENIASYNGETLPSTWISDRDVYASGTTPTTGAQVVYKLATPTTVQLTAQEVELLVGLNQVWANSGDVSVEYGLAPNILINPTLFESSPMLEVEGYGTVGFNGYEIELADTRLGDIELGTYTYAANARRYTFDEAKVNDGDAMYFGGSTPSYFAHDITRMNSNVTVTGAVIVESTNCEQQVQVYSSFVFWKEVPDLSAGFVVGTPSAITWQAKCTVTYKVSGTAYSVDITHDNSLSYDGSNAIVYTYSTSYSVSNAPFMLRPDGGLLSLYANSTVDALGHPTYIDCDLGEAYMIKDGSVISLNQYIDLGSNLPKFASGANEITYDDTVTDLKVIPRWWKI